MASFLGLNTGQPILPKPNIPEKTPGVFGPDYSFADNIPLPGDVGIREGDSIGSVIDAVKGAAYYVDLIGFGESSSSLTKDLGVKRLGVNTWMKTGFQCSNGADMYTYLEGIPTGNSLGKGLSKGLASAGLPQLAGLAPGIIEDVEGALDPRPILGAVFGSGYPLCRLEAKQVGDQDGRIKNTDSDAYYVEDPTTVYCSEGGTPDASSGKCAKGVPLQKRWVKSGDLDSTQYKNSTKTHCPDGYTKGSHDLNDCARGLLKNSSSWKQEGFCGGSNQAVELFNMIGAAAGVLLLIGVAFKLGRV